MFLSLGKNLRCHGLLIFMTSKGDPRQDPWGGLLGVPNFQQNPKTSLGTSRDVVV